MAGQYVLGKIREARERMTEDRTSKEKYVGCGHDINLGSDSYLAVSVGDLNRIKKTAHTPC